MIVTQRWCGALLLLPSSSRAAMDHRNREKNKNKQCQTCKIPRTHVKSIIVKSINYQSISEGAWNPIGSLSRDFRMTLLSKVSLCRGRMEWGVRQREREHQPNRSIEMMHRPFNFHPAPGSGQLPSRFIPFSVKRMNLRRWKTLTLAFCFFFDKR